MIRLYLWFCRMLFVARGPWVRWAPGLPCALFDFEGGCFEQLGQIRAARMRTCGCLKFETEVAEFVMAGLVPAIHVLLRNCVVEIVPIRICGDDQSNLPSARPMLNIVLALDGVSNVVKLLEVDQPFQPIPFSEAIDEAGPMFEHSANQIACYSNVEDAVRTIGQNVNVGRLPCRDTARRGWPGQARP
jgi:hypothetical protein